MACSCPFIPPVVLLVSALLEFQSKVEAKWRLERHRTVSYPKWQSQNREELSVSHRCLQTYTGSLDWCIVPLERHTERNWVSLPFCRAFGISLSDNTFVTTNNVKIHTWKHFFASVDMGAWVKWTDHKIRNRTITSRTHLLSAVEPQRWREQSHLCALMKCDRRLETEGWHFLTAPPSAARWQHHWKLLVSGHHNLLRAAYYCTSKSQVTRILELYVISFVHSPLTLARILILGLSVCSLAGCLTFQIIIKPIA